MATQLERRTATRAAIIESAFAAFADHGSPDVALDEIAAAAGVTKSTVLYHFTNRTGLLTEVAVWLLARVEQRLTDAARSDERAISAHEYVRVVLTEQATPVGRVLYSIGDELLLVGGLDEIDPYRYLRARLDQLGVGEAAMVTAAAVVQFGRQLAFGLASPDEIDDMLHALGLTPA